VVLVWTDAEGHFIALSNSAPLPPGMSGWRELQVSAKPPSGAAAVEIDLQVCEDPGTTWLDDVRGQGVETPPRLAFLARRVCFDGRMDVRPPGGR
jgi:hypothetical protein